MSARSGAEVFEALLRGQPVSWGFNPLEKRVLLTLPESLGGGTHVLCIAGHYTFTLADPEAAMLVLQNTIAAAGALGQAGRT